MTSPDAVTKLQAGTYPLIMKIDTILGAFPALSRREMCI
jgi:hypothetical protein